MIADTLRRVNAWAGATYTVTVVFSEPVYGFGAEDVTIPNATMVSGISTSDNITYTFNITPNPGVFVESNTIDVTATGVTNAVSWPGSATASSSNYIVNTV